jgi:hypothetical protein
MEVTCPSAEDIALRLVNMPLKPDDEEREKKYDEI